MQREELCLHKNTMIKSEQMVVVVMDMKLYINENIQNTRTTNA